MPKNVIYTIILIFGIVAVILITQNLITNREHFTTIQDEGREPPGINDDAAKPIVFGSENAPLKIEACLPLNVKCHKETTALITKLAQDHPKLIRAEIVDMNGRAGAAMQKKYKTSCATIFFNGQSKLKLKRGGDEGAEENVYFSGPLDYNYTAQDITLAAQKILRDIKGDAVEILNLTTHTNEDKNE